MHADHCNRLSHVLQEHYGGVTSDFGTDPFRLLAVSKKDTHLPEGTGNYLLLRFVKEDFFHETVFGLDRLKRILERPLYLVPKGA